MFPYLTLSVSSIANLLFDERPLLPELDATTTINPYYGYGRPMQGNPPTISFRDTGAGERDVRVMYLTQGLSWEPVYTLDQVGERPEKPERQGWWEWIKGLVFGSEQSTTQAGDDRARFGYWAKVTNTLGHDLDDVKVRLIGGSIRLAQRDGYEGYSMSGILNEEMTHSQRALDVANMIADQEYSLPPVSTSSLEEYEVYDLPGTQTLRAGETKLISLYEDDVDVERLYVWDAREPTPAIAATSNGRPRPPARSSASSR